MAKLIRDEEVEIVDGHPIFTYRWKGIGIAYMPDMWLIGAGIDSPTFILGNLSLRFVGVCKDLPFGVYITQDNWRWPLWWLLLRIWLFSRWFERNLRLTAAVWGLLKCEPGAMPQWGDFVAWRWVKRERRKTERRR